MSKLELTKKENDYLREQLTRLIKVKFATDPNKEKRHEYQVLSTLKNKFVREFESELQLQLVGCTRQELKITQQILEATLKGLTEKTIPTYNTRLAQGDSKYTMYLAKCAGLVSEIGALNKKVGELI